MGIGDFYILLTFFYLVGFDFWTLRAGRVREIYFKTYKVCGGMLRINRHGTAQNLPCSYIELGKMQRACKYIAVERAHFK